MAGVDLNVYRFDYDLTFAVLLMNADGTIYHRYGTRSPEGASSRLSMTALIRLMRDTLPTHRAYLRNPRPPKPPPRRTVEDIPAMARKLKKKRIDCIHCHMAYDALREEAQSRGRWDPGEIWKLPLPDQIGLLLEIEDPTRVVRVRRGSPPWEIGLRAGDRLLRAGTQRLGSHADLQWALENVPPGGGELRIQFERAGKNRTAALRLRKGWKESDPYTVSWRPTIWGYRPAPGFGGPQLKPEELRKLGLSRDAFAFRLTYLVTWGPNAKYGRNAIAAGLRIGDIVLAVAGKNDFRSVQHFHSWFRLTRKPGAVVEIRVLRRGKPMTFRLPVLPD